MNIGVLARLLAAVLALAPAPAIAAVLHVAPNGVDPGCGPLAHPCQTITQAIVNAADGDRIVVGPGVYGDIDGDGAFGSAGEEPAQAGFGCRCVVLVDKRVTLESSAGAGATIIDAGNADLRGMLVTVSGAVIGRRDRGFTVRNSFAGIVLDGGDSIQLTGVRIEDNRLMRNGAGLSTQGARGAVVSGNVIADNTFLGASLGGVRQTFTGNVVARTIFGVGVPAGDHTVSDNVVIENMFGIGVSPGAHAIRRNTVTGQLEEGIGIASAASGAYASLVLTGNNLFDNGLGSSNCAVVSTHVDVIDAERNYWGRATGPGPDPGDDACGDFDAVPFATRPIPIANSAGR
jgi:hypothetical protein